MDVHVDALREPTEHSLQHIVDASFQQVGILKLQQLVGLEIRVGDAFPAVRLWGVGHQPAHITSPISTPCVQNTRPRPFSGRSGRLHCALYAAEY